MGHLNFLHLEPWKATGIKVLDYHQVFWQVMHSFFLYSLTYHNRGKTKSTEILIFMQEHLLRPARIGIYSITYCTFQHTPPKKCFLCPTCMWDSNAHISSVVSWALDCSTRCHARTCHAGNTAPWWGETELDSCGDLCAQVCFAISVWSWSLPTSLQVLQLSRPRRHPIQPSLTTNTHISDLSVWKVNIVRYAPRFLLYTSMKPFYCRPQKCQFVLSEILFWPNNNDFVTTI